MEEYKKVTISFTKEQLEKLNEMNFHWIRVLYMYPDELSDLVQILHISRETNVKPGVYPNFSGYFLQYKKQTRSL